MQPRRKNAEWAMAPLRSSFSSAHLAAGGNLISRKTSEKEQLFLDVLRTFGAFGPSIVRWSLVGGTRRVRIGQQRLDGDRDL
jgi:hypothetical protein